jgi:hypothetical protein
MTTITLQLSPELEQQLRLQAAQQGIHLDRYILNALQERLQPSWGNTAADSKTETDLLEQINLGLSSDRWADYHSLIAKRRAETLTDAEQSRLITISDEIEQANVLRVRALIALAELRGSDLSTLMRELSIIPQIDG